MSWFFGSTNTYVSSVVYNLAGDILKRPNYMKTSLIGAVLGNAPSLPAALLNSYLTGPGIKLRNFASWAREQDPAVVGTPGTYDKNIGMNTSTITSGHNIDNVILAAEIPVTTGTISVQSSLIDQAAFIYWTDQYVAANKPDQLMLGYTSSMDNATHEITIEYADHSTDKFTPVGFDPFGSYLYATYLITVAGVWGSPLVFIYKKGSGNAALDGMWNAPTNLTSFLPFIPYRIDNKNVVDEFPDTVYPLAKKALKKALNANYDDVTKAINDNASLKDIDYAYVVFGCSLNTLDNAAKTYIYKFFQTIMNDPGQVNQTSYGTWEDEWLAAKASWDVWSAWSTTRVGPEPVLIPFPTMPINSVSVTSNSNSVMDYNMVVSWNYMYEDTGTGLLKPDAKIDQLWLESTTVPTYSTPVWGFNPITHQYEMQSVGPTMADGVVISWQIDASHWRRLTIVGLVHNNYVYKGNAVTILAKDALADANESGFIIPLHEDIFKTMSLKDFTQMTTACCYLMFNCYQVVKTPWYATGWFQIILIVVIIVISVLTMGAGTVGASAGLLGVNSTVGTAIIGTAASATMIAIVGAIANALVAMIVVMIINKIAVLALGPKLGAMIGAFISLLVLQVGSGMASGQSFSTMFHKLTTIMSLLTLTNAVGNGLASYVKAGIQDTMKETTTYQEQLNAQSASIEQQAYAEFGSGTVTIDASTFSDSTGTPDGIVMEPSSMFLTRTLMTGTDLAELSNSMLTDFCSLTLSTDLLLST